MIEKVLGLKKMNILQCQEAAKDCGYDGATFKLCGLSGSLNATWLDAYLGLLQIEGQDDFLSVQQFKFNDDVWCEDLMPKDDY